MATPIPQNHAEFSVRELLEATGGRLRVGVDSVHVHGVATDSRDRLVGKVFVALRGEHFDAHEFLSQALAQGANALVVESHPRAEALIEQLVCEPTSSAVVISVDDTLVALGQLAHAHRKRWGGKVVAVAGAAGKTTTRSAISALLEVLCPGEVHHTQGNLNNRIGVPMTLLGLREQHRYAVIEIGTNCSGEVGLLSGLVLPDVALLTLIDLEHTEGLGDLDGVEQEEKQVFSWLRGKQAAIGWGDHERVRRCVDTAPCELRFKYGFSPYYQLHIAQRRLLNPLECRLKLQRDDGSQLSFSTSLIGRPGALASAAAVLAVETLTQERLSDEQCQQALALAGEPGRHTVFELHGGRYVVDDSYNSNPASVESSVATGREIARHVGGRLFLVLGEMLELGGLARSAHLQMGRVARASGAVAACFIQGETKYSAQEARGGAMEVEFFEDSRDVAAFLESRLKPRDVVVIKASRGVRAERVLEGLSQVWPRADASTSKEASTPEVPGEWT